MLIVIHLWNCNDASFVFLSEKANPPSIQISGNVNTKIGEEITILCQSIGSPPYVRWLKDGEPVDATAESGILITQSVSRDIIVSILTIVSSKREDSGIYECMSSHGNTAKAQVFVYSGKPQCF